MKTSIEQVETCYFITNICAMRDETKVTEFVNSTVFITQTNKSNDTIQNVVLGKNELLLLEKLIGAKFKQ